MSLDPRVLQLCVSQPVILARIHLGRVVVDIGDPVAVLGGRQHPRPEGIAVCIGSLGATQVLPNEMLAEVADDFPFAAQYEHVPLPLNVGLVIVVGDGRLKALFLVPLNGLGNHGFRIFRRTDLRRRRFGGLCFGQGLEGGLTDYGGLCWSG